MESVPAGFIEKLGAYKSHLDTTNGYAFLVGCFKSYTAFKPLLSESCKLRLSRSKL